MMLWRNWNAAFRIATNEIPVNAVTELAARNIRKNAAFRGDFRRPEFRREDVNTSDEYHAEDDRKRSGDECRCAEDPAFVVAREDRGFQYHGCAGFQVRA